MAITITLLTSGSSTGGSPYTTASLTMEPGRIYIAALGASAFAPTVGTFSITNWDAIPSTNGQLFSGDQYRIDALKRTVTSTTTGTLSISNTGSANGATWAIFEIAGDIDSSGTNGANGIVQNVKGTTAGGSPNDFSLTLAALGDATNNMVLGLWANDNAAACTPSSGYTEIADVNGAGVNIGLQASYKVAGTTTPGVTCAADFADIGGIAIELKYLLAGGMPATRIPFLGSFGRPRTRYAI